EIDKQIAQLQMRTPFDLDSQVQIDALQQQRENNLQHMNQPMTAEEYDEYDDNGEYTGNQSSMPASDFATQDSNIGQTAIDGVNHLAQGASLGWSDELNGVIGGAGRVAANGLMRATGNNANGESFGDAWNKGYAEYRDFARQELNNGYQRNPAISTGSEIIGSAMSPVKIHTPRGYTGSTLGNFISHPEDIARSRWINTIGTGTINGAGYTNDNNPAEYGENIIKSTMTNVSGTILGNKMFGKGNDMYKLGRGTMNAFTQSTPYGYNYFRKKDEDE
ncbi:MAG: hypothetical protein IKO06_00955, partial [Alphaproteobacteria bacterium]|nr:hypothetical protein [Alphaproteobacteria bacterium]